MGQLARRIWNETDGKLTAGYDPNVGKALSEVDIAKPVPTMWEHFEVLAENAADGAARRELGHPVRRHGPGDAETSLPNMTAAVIQHEGHAPLLLDLFSQRLIGDFLAEADKSWEAPVRARMPGFKRGLVSPVRVPSAGATYPQARTFILFPELLNISRANRNPWRKRCPRAFSRY